MSYHDADGITVHHGDCLDVHPSAYRRGTRHSGSSLPSVLKEWKKWNYEYQGKERMWPLPADWRVKISDLVTAGLSQPDMLEAVTIAMSAYGVKDEFSYFIGVCRQRIAQRQSVASELIRRGLV